MQFVVEEGYYLFPPLKKKGTGIYSTLTVFELLWYLVQTIKQKEKKLKENF